MPNSGNLFGLIFMIGFVSLFIYMWRQAYPNKPKPFVIEEKPFDHKEFLKDFAEELYFRAAACKQMREEYMAIKGVQHSLEEAMEKHGIPTFQRPSTK
jgi:hypothetical protein